MTYPLADFVVQFNTALKNNEQYVYVKYSKAVNEVVAVLKQQNCIASFNVMSYETGSSVISRLRIRLLYVNNVSLVKDLCLMSKPGLRVF